MSRGFWLVLHRYAGLGMAAFLIVVALTGSVLAFHQELDGWLNPGRDRVAVRSAPLLQPFELRERAKALVPNGENYHLDLSVAPDRVYEIFFAPPLDPSTGKLPETGYTLLKLDPYSGEELSRSDPSLDERRLWPLHRGNLLDFVWQLHIQLVMGHTGGLVLGIVALVWFVDCFISVYLTWPGRRHNVGSASEHHRLARWRVAWKIKWPASAFRVNFDLHRAGGLWTWPLLFMFAWSSGTFNLPAVFHPMNDFFFGPLPQWKPPMDAQSWRNPPVDLRSAHLIARRLMDDQARLHQFEVLHENYIAYNPQGGYFSYTVKGDKLFGDQDATYIAFDAVQERVLYLHMPSGLHASVTLINWLSGLHTAAIWGLPYQAFVFLMGLVISLLSGTGIYLWWKKHRARLARQRRSRHP